MCVSLPLQGQPGFLVDVLNQPLKKSHQVRITATMADLTAQGILVALSLTMTVGRNSAILSKIDPQTNMWVTWAKQTGQSSFCLFLASASDPFVDELIMFEMVKGSYAKNCSKR